MKHYFAFKSLFTLLLLMLSFGVGRAQGYEVNDNYLAANKTTEVIRVAGNSVEIPLKSYVGDGSVFARVFLADAQTLDPLYELTSSFEVPSDYNDYEKALFLRTEYGYINFPRRNSTRTNKNIVLNLPSGKDLADLAVVVLKKNVGGGSIDDENKKAADLGIKGDLYYSRFKVTSDPTSWDAYRVYTFDIPKKFSPYEGVANAVGDFEVNANGRKRQRTHTCVYDYYVAPGSTIMLQSPDLGSSIDFNSYWRWYDNKTFAASERIKKGSGFGNNLLEGWALQADGSSAGLIYKSDATNGNAPSVSNFAAVRYTAPNDVTWTGDEIAADASRYTDGDGYDDSSPTFREPTLSTRFIWRIRPNSEIAGNIKQALLRDDTYEDHGNIVVAMSDKTSEVHNTLRLDLHDVGQYWFYSYDVKGVGQKLQETDFGTEVLKAQSFSWFVLVESGNKVYKKSLGAGSTFSKTIRYDLHAKDVIGTYENVNNKADILQLDTLLTGQEYVVVAYANSQTSDSGNRTSPVARFNCYFALQHEPQVSSNVSLNRSIEKLSQLYTPVGIISFDDFKGMNFEKPEHIYEENSSTNNVWHHPLPWNEANYGFVYPQLIKRDKANKGYGKPYMPFHSEYTLIKQACGPAAPNGTGAYDWNGTIYNELFKNNGFHDRTYEISNHTKYGHFLFVDASAEARPIVELDFEAKLCSGSTILCSAAVANFVDTGNNDMEFPNLLFKLYGLKKDAAGNVVERKLVQTFSSGDFKKHGAKEYAKWYQVFAKTFITPKSNAEQFASYSVTVDNNCVSTVGADYAIDDIRFFVTNDKIEVLQEGNSKTDCDKKDNDEYLTLRMDYAMLKTKMDLGTKRKPFFFRICTEDGKPVQNLTYPTEKAANGQTRREQRKDANGVTYGVVWMDPLDADNADAIELDPYGLPRFKLTDKAPFRLLDLSKKYYISGSFPKETADGGFEPEAWGESDNTCSVYSKLININYQSLVVNTKTGQVSNKFFSKCGDATVEVKLTAKLAVPDAQYGGKKEIDWKFDWLIGDKNLYEQFAGTDGKGAGLTALQHFRTAYPLAPKFDYDLTTHTGTTLPKGVFTDADAQELAKYSSDPSEFDKGKLLILYVGGSTLDTKLPINVVGGVNTYLYYVPYAGYYPDEKTTPNYMICPEPFATSVTLSHESPQIYLGFPKVTYPDEMENTAKYIRLGKRQAEDLQAGKILRLPVHSYRDANLNEQAGRHHLVIEEDDGNHKAIRGQVRLVATNDPTMKDKVAQPPSSSNNFCYTGGKVAEVVPGDCEITPSTQTIGFDFSKYDVKNKITFHEGYDYQFVFTYHDATKTIGGSTGSTENICFSYTLFTLRIVPEYVTWTGAEPNNTNWNNDLNWRRSSKEELQKADYEDYGTEGGTAGLLQTPGADPSTTPQAFVPMKFTKVTINPGVSVPYLGNFKVDANQEIITDMLNPTLSEGTPLIAYDLMVKTTLEADGSYACEPFYANTCEQVYFRSDRTAPSQGDGQLLYQHYLDYKTAWVDMPLYPDRWNMVASPLRSVCAGDFYLPKETGMQQTEAFKPITFDPTKYSRTEYPVYQRNWNKTESRVYNKANGSWFDATVPFDENTTDTLAVIQSEWGHAYNDVQVSYLPGQGFSVMPRLKEGSKADPNNALFRFPKADTQYEYYRYDGASGGLTQEVMDRSKAGLLATSLSADDDPQKLSGIFTVHLKAGTHVRGGYFLLGNPYMGTLQMSRFFNDNPVLFRKYWTFNEKGELVAHGGSDADLGKLAPMTAFFVKSKAGENDAEVEFRPDHCVRLTDTSALDASPTRQLSLSATTASGATTLARLIADPAASDDFDEDEDVETLFDSNLGEQGAPQLFTVAGARAASINSVSDLRNVALGVSTAEDCDVELRLTGVDELSEPLYLYDALNRTTRPVREGEALTIRSNAMGRYILTSKTMVPESAVRTAIRCYPTGQQGRVVASTEPTDRIRQIQIYDNLGRLRQEFFPNEPTHTFTLLPREVFLVTILTDDVPEGRTFKVIPR